MNYLLCKLAFYRFHCISLRFIYLHWFIFSLGHFYHSKHLVLLSHPSCWLERCQWCRWSPSPPRWPVRERPSNRRTLSPVRTPAPWCPISVSRLLHSPQTPMTHRCSAPLLLRFRTLGEQLRQRSPLRLGLRSRCLDLRVQSHRPQLPSLAPSHRSSTRFLISSRSHRPYLSRTKYRFSRLFPSLCPRFRLQFPIRRSSSRPSRLFPSLSPWPILQFTPLCISASRCLSSSLIPRLRQRVSPKEETTPLSNSTHKTVSLILESSA